jgi:dihydrofolate reductase
MQMLSPSSTVIAPADHLTQVLRITNPNKVRTNKKKVFVVLSIESVLPKSPESNNRCFFCIGGGDLVTTLFVVKLILPTSPTQN